MGLSRRSSVPGLNDRPSSPTRRLPVDSTVRNTRSIWLSFDGRMLSRIGIATSARRARWTRARRSLGRQEPPNAYPGRRYAGEMLSFVSAVTMSITAWLSRPSALHTAPISLANPAFRAWKLLSAYLIISATPSGTR
jgi:hypothetical protein